MRHWRTLAAILVLMALVGCVYVARQGSYTNSKHILGSNRVVDIEISPK